MSESTTSKKADNELEKHHPKPVEVGREAVIVIAGALVAAAIIGNLPGLRDWIKAQWSGGSANPEETPWL